MGSSWWINTILAIERHVALENANVKKKKKYAQFLATIKPGIYNRSEKIRYGSWLRDTTYFIETIIE